MDVITATTHNVTYDLGTLTMFDSTPLKIDDKSAPGFEQELTSLTKSNLVKFWQTLFTLKKEKDAVFDEKLDEHKIYDFDSSPWVITLPPKESVFPRHKKLPVAKASTRFEKWAKDRGIQKKTKRSRMVYDDVTKQMLPRYGPYSVKKTREQFDVIREVKDGEDPTVDPFLKSKMEKRLKIEKQNLREVRNKLEAKGLSTKNMKPNKEEVIQKKFKTMNNKTKEKKKQNSKVLSIAQKSTASMGNFDRKAHNDEPEMKLKRRNNVKPLKSVKEEKKRDLEMLDFVAKTGGSKKVKK